MWSGVVYCDVEHFGVEGQSLSNVNVLHSVALVVVGRGQGHAVPPDECSCRKGALLPCQVRPALPWGMPEFSSRVSLT